MFGQHRPKLGELRLGVAGFQEPGLIDQPGQPSDFLPQHCGVGREDFAFKLADDPQLFLFGEFVEVLGNSPLDLLAAVGFRVGEDLFPPLPIRSRLRRTA